MKIHLSQYAGFCDGVKRAYDMIMDLDFKGLKKPVLALGSLVHNEEVVAKIEARGIKTIGREEFFSAEHGEIGTLIITAHGTGPGIFALVKERGIDIIDTTCPRVIKAQRLAQVYSKLGYKIIIVGDKDHKEVRGIDEWGGGNGFVVSEEKDLSAIPFGLEDKIAVLAQTTQNEDFFSRIFYLVKKKYKNAEMIKTTCHTTHSRQGEVKLLAKENDVVIIIGSQKSANSGRLFEISKTVNPKSYFIENEKGIEDAWFSGISSVGITAGASTPNWIIEKVLERIEKI